MSPPSEIAQLFDPLPRTQANTSSPRSARSPVRCSAGRRAVAAMMLVAVGAVGCTDDPARVSGPSVPRASAQRAMAGSVDESRDMGDVALRPFGPIVATARGSMRPGQPIVLQVRASAKLSATEVVLRIQLPDLERVEYRRRERRRPPPLLPIPDRASWRGAVGAGGTVQQQTTFTVPAPGLYRARVHLTTNAGPLHENRPVSNVSTRDVWFWITPSGGRFFDSETGPFRDQSIIQSPYYAQALYGDGCEEYPGAPGCEIDCNLDPYAPGCPPPDPNATTVRGTVTYSNSRIGYTTLARALVVIFDPQGWFNGSTYSDGNGEFTLPCPPPEAADRSQIVVATDNDVVLVNWANRPGGPPRDVLYYPGISSAHCGAHLGGLAVGLNTQSELFDNLTRTAFRADTSFDELRPKVTADFVVHDSAFAGYNRNTQTITVSEGAMLNSGGAWALFTAAHEYGHAYYHRSLDGPPSAANCAGHRLEEASPNFECAWREGFANYFAAQLWQTALAPYDAIFTDNWYVGQGMLGEGAVAALLLDFSDGAKSDRVGMPGASTTFTDSYTGYSWYAAKAAEVCTVKGERIDGADFLAHCYEQNIRVTGSMETCKFPNPLPYPQCMTNRVPHPEIDLVAHNAYFHATRGGDPFPNPTTWQWYPMHNNTNRFGFDSTARALWRCNLFREC